MATTDFTGTFNGLTLDQKKVWSRDLWKVARNRSFLNQFTGSGHNAMVSRVSELTKTERGDQAIVTLVPDLTGDGIAGDSQLEGSEEAITAYDQTITIDQLRNANRIAGRMSEQKTIIKFRETSRDVLGYWMADRIDQMGFLTLSGVAYTETNNGGTRASGTLPALAFASDVAAPTTERGYRWDAASGSLVATEGNTTTLTTRPLVTATDTLSYRTIVEAKALAKSKYIRGIQTSGGEEFYHMFVSPQAMAKLKLDTDYLANVRNAGVRGKSNELFAGTSSVLVDGIVVHEYRHVYNTSGAAVGSKWGDNIARDIDGCRVLFCGAQSMAWADLGMPYWEEDDFDYKNQVGISVGKIFGMLKPQFWTDYAATPAKEDFGVVTIDVAQ